MSPRDCTVREAIPTTSVARTLLDLADVASEARVRQAYERSLTLRLFDRDQLISLLDRSAGRRGRRVLRHLLAEADEPPILRSHLERELLDLCRAHGIPVPATNVVVCGFEVDALWPEAKLIVELDGYAHHRGREAFERDRARDRALLLAGHRTIRLTADHLRGDPDGVAADLRTALGI